MGHNNHHNPRRLDILIFEAYTFYRTMVSEEGVNKNISFVRKDPDYKGLFAYLDQHIRSDDEIKLTLDMEDKPKFLQAYYIHYESLYKNRER